MKRAAAAALGLMLGLLVGCSGGDPTQILIEVDSDLLVPDELDRIAITAEGPGGATQRSSADLGPGRIPLPRTLTMVHEQGPLGPYRVTVRGEDGGVIRVERAGSLSFRSGEVLVWRVRLDRSCEGVSCAEEQTCAEGSCRPVAVEADELPPFGGSPPPLDAGAFDACVPDERCNGVDDDCDGAVDEGFDLSADPQNCGSCGAVCAQAHGTVTCEAGACAVQSCEAGFGDCDGVGTNGCETDLTSSSAHCGSCGTSCEPPTRECCAGTCARGC